MLNPNNNELCIGVHKCALSHKIIVLIVHIIYILLWTLFFNFLCKNKLTQLAWFILIIPFLFTAIIFAGMIFMNPVNPSRVTPPAKGGQPPTNMVRPDGYYNVPNY